MNRIEQLWEQICQNMDVRQSLSKLRQELKEDAGREILLLRIAGEEKALTALLECGDAKTRKNAALLMGALGKQEFLQPLYQAYLAESQMFVKSAYLTAMKNFDAGEYREELKERLAALAGEEATEENQKHLAEEMRELSSLVIRMEPVRTHRFLGLKEGYDIVLLTNRNYTDMTMDRLKALRPRAKARTFNAGVIAGVEDLEWAEELREYHELLFTIKGMPSCPMDPEAAANIIAGSQLLDFLERGHEGEPPFYFRAELKSKMEPDKKGQFVKKLSAGIEQKSMRRLINTTSEYEILIRLVENKEGNANLLVKLYTRKDSRFAYRKEAVPAGIRPVNAALTAELARKYMKEDAQVLDPFCGAGTMLIERHKAVRANTTYGIDIQADAIEKARKNTKEARQIIHYINRDFFDFKHEYLFDEIITDMPFQIGRITEMEISILYERFFKTAGKFIKEDGTLILYSHNRELVRKLAPGQGFCTVKEYEISKREGTYVFIIARGERTAELLKNSEF